MAFTKNELDFPSIYTEDISEKMRVPKRIQVDGNLDDNTMSVNYNTILDNEKFNMQVPERILVVGQEQHVGTKAPPRELLLENSLITHDREEIRVETPPRVITLEDHYFPSVDDTAQHEDIPIIRSKKTKSKNAFNTDHPRENSTQLSLNFSNNESIAPREEFVHLRRQMANLNRRILAMEEENKMRRQREKWMFITGITYLLIKTVIWLNRSG